MQTLAAERWEITEKRLDQLDYGEALFNGRLVDALQVELNIASKNRLVGKYSEYCRRIHALKDEDFIKAARLDGNRPMRIIFKYMLPNFLSHIIAVVTLAIPGMIIAETSLSFLGIGLRQPVVSWGVLLQEAQNLKSISTAPWLFLPGFAVVLAVLSLNFLGDGLRDAGDPYET